MRKGIKKYRTFKEAELNGLFSKKNNIKFILKSLFSLSLFNKIVKKIPHGLYKYKSFEEANEDELKWLSMD